MEKVKITFLMTAFNSKRFIRDTIKSVLNQSEKNIRLIIRNNASTDETESICKEFMQKDSRIIYLENKVPYFSDEGFTIFQREWWPEFESEYVAIIDHDDLLDSEFAKKMYHAAKKYQADMTICGNYFFKDGTNQITGTRTAPDMNCTDMSCLGNRINLYYGLLRCVWAKLYEKEFYDKYYKEVFIVPADLKLSVDTYIIFNYLERCRSFVCIEAPLYYYRVSDDSQFNSQKIKTFRIREADFLFEKAKGFLHMFHADSSKSINFLYAVHWGHMTDLIQLLTRSRSMSIFEKLEFIQEIFKNQMVVGYAEENLEYILKTVFACIKHIKNDDKCTESALFQYYIYRLYQAYQENSASADCHLYLTILSAVSDPDNVSRLGISLLNLEWGKMNIGQICFMKSDMKHKKHCFSDLSQLRSELAHPNRPNDFMELEDELSRAANQEDWSFVTELLETFDRIYPIDEYAIYYRLYFSFMTHETEAAKKQAYISKILWPDSPEIIELCQLILGQESDVIPYKT